MNFREATDGLFARIDQAEFAKRLGVSVATIRQARMRSDARAHRTPPENWPDAVVGLAEAQIAHYRKLIESVRRGTKVSTRRTVTRDADATPSLGAAKGRN